MMRRSRPLDSLDEDIRDHLEREIQDNIDRGLAPDEARRRALLAFGNVALAKEDARAIWVRPWLDQLRQDIRYTCRTIRRNPGFAAVVVLTLGLGIGANTAIFSVFEVIALRTVGLASPDELYFVAHGSLRSSPSSNYPYFERIRARSDLFAGATTYMRSTFKVSAGDDVETVRGQFVSGNYHAVLGVPIALGRGFASEDDRAGSDSLVAVISDVYWARKFDRDPRVLGRTLVIDQRPISIVGVTAPGFSGLDPGTRVDVTLPLAVRTLDAANFLTNHGTWLGDAPVIVRLAQGMPRDRAASAVDALFQQYLGEPDNGWLRKIPGWDHVSATLIPANRGTGGLRREYSTSINVLMAMVGVVLLIGCANVANLLLARGTARAKEVAVRMSIGADRARLVRQFLTESILLALIGGALGLLLARAGVAAIAALVSTGPEAILLDVQPNATVLGFTIAVSLLTGLLFGLMPAFGCTRVDVTPALRAAGAAMRPGGRRWSVRQALVAAQIGLCVLLVSCAGLLGRTLRNLETRESGITRENLLLFSVDARRTAFRAEQLPTLCHDLIERLIGRAAVVSGSCSRNIPVNSRGNAAPLEIPGAPAQPPNARQVFTNMVTPDYFRTLGIALVGGRVFDSRDTASSERVAVVNRAVVRLFFGNENPIGRRVHFYQDEAHPMTIVGVVEDAAQRSLREDPPRTVYTPLSQLSQPEELLTVALRTRQDPAALAGSVRDEVRALSPHVVVDYIRTMEQQIEQTLVRERLVAMLSSAFGALALVLSCIGLYGVVSYDVARSVRELGIRLALGAQRLDVLGGVVRGALSVSLIGILAGLVAALAATRVLGTLLFRITARDPVTLASAAALLLLTTLLASYIPARRASRVDPITVLRME